MCGIYLSKDYDEEILNLIHNRGKDSFQCIMYNNLYICSSVLAIRSIVKQPIKTQDFIFLYNGEIYNNKESDTLFISDMICETLQECNVVLNTNGLCCIDNPSYFLQKFYKKINIFQNELALVIVFQNVVLFFKDDVGKKSLGLSKDKFQLSSVKYEIELDNLNLYSYDLQRSEMSSYKKQNFSIRYFIESHKYLKKYFLEDCKISEGLLEEFSQFPMNRSYSGTVDFLDQILKKAFKKRLVPNNLVVFFSGGVDSVLVALYLHLVSDLSQTIYLINTGFEDSHDRKAGLNAYLELKRLYIQRSWQFIRVNINLDDLKLNYINISNLIYPKKRSMDFNIGFILHYTALEARKYSKVCFLGSGADELFGGYSKYKKENCRHRMLLDVVTLSYNNLSRDDRVISNNNLEARLPLLDSDVINYSFNFNDELIKDKFVIRQLLINYGLIKISCVPKKAMQYGTGLNKYENKYFKSLC